MSVRHLVIAGALALPALLARPGDGPRGIAAQTRVVAAVQSPVEEGRLADGPPPAWAQADPADSLYRQARDLLNRNEYRRAAALFGQIAERYPRSAYADDALYWRAFALYRSGSEDDLREALRALDAQQERYPKAATKGDAKTLKVRIRGALAQRGDEPSARAVTTAVDAMPPCDGGDRGNDDLRMEAMNALLQMSADRALPIIKQVLARRDECSVALRKKAVFLLSQKPSSETETIMLDVVQRDPSQRVREDAVFWLGQVNGERAAAALEDIALRSPDQRLREKAVFALGQQNAERGQAVVRRIAESDDTPRRVREQAIFQLGQQRSATNAEFLRDLFRKLGTGDEGLRKNVLFSLSQMRGMGNDRWLLGVAGDASQSVEVRKHALWTAGQAGVPASEFVPLYDRIGEPRLKEHLIWVLSESRDRAAADKLIDIARTDRDREMRKKAIFWLGQMHDPRIQQLLLDIITKG